MMAKTGMEQMPELMGSTAVATLARMPTFLSRMIASNRFTS